MRRLIIGALAMCFMSVASAKAYIEPRVGARVGYHLSGGDDPFTVQQLFAGLKYENEFEQVEFKLDTEFSHDFVYDSQNNYSTQAEDDLEDYWKVDDAYFSFELFDAYWTLGYQKVVWGEADDLRVVDVVNPLDLRDFVLFDVDEYRVALPMLKVEQYIGDESNLSFLTVFQYQSNRYAPAGAEFGDTAFSGLDERKAGHLEFGIRFNTYWMETDVSLYSFYGYEDDLFSIPDSAGNIQKPLNRFKMFGLSTSKAIDNWVIRTEWLYEDDLKVMDSSANLVAVNKYQGLLGLDYRYRDWTATFQYTDRRYDDWQQTLTVTHTDPTITFSLEREYLSGRLSSRLAITYMDVSGGGRLDQLKLTYKYNAKTKFNLNLDSLSGNKNNLLGHFREQDRVWLALTYYL